MTTTTAAPAPINVHNGLWIEPCNGNLVRAGFVEAMPLEACADRVREGRRRFERRFWYLYVVTSRDSEIAAVFTTEPAGQRARLALVAAVARYRNQSGILRHDDTVGWTFTAIDVPATV